MKQIIHYILLFFVLLPVASCEDNLDSPVNVNPAIKANSKVLVELFSNVMCVACVQSANYCDDISYLRGVTINDTNVIIINIHSSLFQGDPFYSFNSGMNTAREDYYNVLFNPAGYTMGSIMTAPFSAGQWTNQINQRLNRTNEVSLSLVNIIDTSTRTGILQITAGLTGGQVYNDLKLYAAVTENNLYFNAPNGKTNYNNILRQMLTDFNGEAITINPGQPANLLMEYTVDERIIQKNARIVVFVQSNSTKEIISAEKIKISE
jgi:hypothetical protein